MTDNVDNWIVEQNWNFNAGETKKRKFVLAKQNWISRTESWTAMTDKVDNWIVEQKLELQRERNKKFFADTGNRTPKINKSRSIWNQVGKRYVERNGKKNWRYDLTTRITEKIDRLGWIATKMESKLNTHYNVIETEMSILKSAQKF